MSYDSRIDELLEEILESERPAEDVCAQCPDLLGEVLERLKSLRSVEAELESLFPLSQPVTKSVAIPLPRIGPDLPLIPGYEVQAILGRGGMGVIYKARHLKLNRSVALKMLLAGSYATQQEHTRFVREAEAAAALRHPNIVQVYDIGEVEGHPYFTMEYVDGGSLAEKMAGASQPVRDAAQTLATLAQAVYVAHQSGIIHRDLKPANILLDDAGGLKISDFGLARRLDGNGGLTNTGDRIGTPSYMAPEQMTGSSTKAGPSVDIFALGAMLYEMLTGRPPFRGKSLSDTERRLTTEEPAPPSRLNAKVPRDLETICLKCLEKDPQNRYAGAGDLAADLERFLRHEPIHARRVAPAERLMRWIRRNPLAAALAVTAVVLVGLVVGVAIQEWALASERRAEKSRLTARFESGVQLVQDERFAEARAILGKLGDGGYEDLRQRIDRTLGDLGLVEELDSIGVRRALAVKGNDSRQFGNAGEEYETVFARTGLGKVHDDPKIVAQRISDSDIQGALVAALDDWAICETDEGRRNWLLEVARRADPDPSGWRDRARDPAKWRDRDVLTQLAETARAAKPSVQLLRVIADRLDAAGLDATAFRKQVQQEHADSFLANFSLANALREKNPAESLRYYQAALAIRPFAAPAYNNLAVTLAALGRTDEAIVHYEQALTIAPQSRRARYNLGLALVAANRLDEAIDQFQRTIKLAPNFGLAHGALGAALLEKRCFAEAEAALRQCLALLPQDHPQRSQMKDLLHRCEQLKSQDY